MNFSYFGTELEGFDHPHNQTILNERAVELAVAAEWLPSGTGAVGLEVGNVLGYYGFSGHRVVDRYEQAAGVDNIDVFDVGGRYEWIISISTLEHVRWDTEPRDPDAALKAITHLRSLLLPGGRMLVTIPAGYHPTLDAALSAGAAEATRDCTLVRSGDMWKQTKKRTFKPYGATTSWAESVWIGEWGA